MYQAVKEAITENHMLSAGDRCIAAVSGGADSTGLLHVLAGMRAGLGISLRAVHVNHGLRGDEAARDADFVRNECEKLGVPFRLMAVDVPGYQKERRLSTEEAARILRYRALEEAAMDWEQEEAGGGPVKIALAHNREDNAETILMQLARGSGLRGTGGIAPVRGRVIRPLLDVTRAEIEKYLTANRIRWVTDSTNLDDEYTRNRMRHDILPRITAEINAGAVENITNAGKYIRQADRYLADQAKKILDSCMESGTDFAEIPTEILSAQDPIIRTYLIRDLIGRISRSMKDITSRHIRDVDRLGEAETGKQIDLPYGLLAERTYQTVRILRKAAGKEAAQTAEKPETAAFSFRIFRYSGEEIPDRDNVKWFDAGKVRERVEIRTRRPGDYIELKGMGKKPLAVYMTDARIPKKERDGILLAADGNSILWVTGHRISEYYKVGKETEEILEIRMNEEK